ncbi:hypothetical protein [Epilithonimonas sp. UC225_85]|uniref:hypothetical protein n=1 Tax=Epilithonimonas sp. UC225_85 TaxID=3350167 RepID=UPI0036D43001
MSRKKERPKFIHKASTQEYLHCLQNMSRWSEILLSQNNGKGYNDFLKWILEKDYCRSNDNLTITQISKLSGYPSAKISKWLQEIYDGILELNENYPDLFYAEQGIQVELYIRYYDSYCSFWLTLPAIPRAYETFEFFFIKAKTGWTTFWVKDVQYSVDHNKSSVCVFLEGGILNKYREFAVEKALFEEQISFRDLYDKFDFEIDDLILGRKRDF